MAKRKTGQQTIFTKNNLKLKEILPLTFNQHKFFDQYETGAHLFVTGCPGTGKSFLSIYNALKEMMEKREIKQLIIMRSVVPGRDIGFLPGTAEEKGAIYEAPYEAMFAELFSRADAYELLKKEGVVVFTTTSFLRGLTFKDCILVVDELQNMKFEELNTVITRAGSNSKLMFCGDFYQTDLNKRNDPSGFHKFKSIIEMIPDFGFIEMGVEDIVRSLLVKRYIMARIEWEKKNEPSKE
jgi:phosphate starvation-inducible protein PhoH